MPKANIHPEYKPATIQCACGHVYESFSTRGPFMVEICANCHPFFTGKQKLMDTAGRIDRFNRKYGRGAGAAGKKGEKPEVKTEAKIEAKIEAKDEVNAEAKVEK